MNGRRSDIGRLRFLGRHHAVLGQHFADAPERDLAIEILLGQDRRRLVRQPAPFVGERL